MQAFHFLGQLFCAQAGKQPAGFAGQLRVQSQGLLQGRTCFRQPAQFETGFPQYLVVEGFGRDLRQSQHGLEQAGDLGEVFLAQGLTGLFAIAAGQPFQGLLIPRRRFGEGAVVASMARA